MTRVSRVCLFCRMPSSPEASKKARRGLKCLSQKKMSSEGCLQKVSSVGCLQTEAFRQKSSSRFFLRGRREKDSRIARSRGKGKGPGPPVFLASCAPFSWNGRNVARPIGLQSCTRKWPSCQPDVFAPIPLGALRLRMRAKPVISRKIRLAWQSPLRTCHRPCSDLEKNFSLPLAAQAVKLSGSSCANTGRGDIPKDKTSPVSFRSVQPVLPTGSSSRIFQPNLSTESSNCCFQPDFSGTSRFV